MSDEILKASDSKLYYAVTKIQNSHKRTEINRIHKGVLKNPYFQGCYWGSFAW